MLHDSILFDNQRIDYSLVFRARRTIGFAVRPDGTVRVSAPAGVPTAWVAQQVLRKAPWILKHQTAFRQHAPAAAARRYEAGTLHYYQGTAYPLELIEDKQLITVLADGRLRLGSPAPLPPAAAEKLLYRWYAHHAPALFAESLARVWPRFAEFNLPRPTLVPRLMRSRWGSCTPGTARIRLSVDLVRAAPGCLDYVLLHECCHLLVPNHSAEFYALQTRLLPDWRQWKEKLLALPR